MRVREGYPQANTCGDIQFTRAVIGVTTIRSSAEMEMEVWTVMNRPAETVKVAALEMW